MVMKTQIVRNGKNYLVSTVYLGRLDSRIAQVYAPLGGGYETMVFECDVDGDVKSYIDIYCERYQTEHAAMQGHAETVSSFVPPSEN
jgi:hypothetical protein